MRAILLSVMSIGLFACSPAPTTGASEEASSASADSSGPVGSPAEQLRPGRWVKTMTAMGSTMTEAECVTTADLDQLAHDPSSNCVSPNGFQRTAEGLVYEAECSGEGGGGHVRTVMNGDLQNNFVVDSVMTGTGEAAGMNIQMHIEGRYDGACHGDE